MTKNKPNLLRVTQMNAIFLDKEVGRTFQQMIQDTLKHLPPQYIVPIGTEINLLLHLGILRQSLFKKDATFGQQMLNIQYENMTDTKRWLYAILSSMDFVRQRLELWCPSHVINSYVFKCFVAFKILDFINTSMFLRFGSKPLLIERILNLKQTYATENAARTIESKYLARELLWNGFIEIIVYVLPMINFHRLRRFIRPYNPFKTNDTSENVPPSREINVDTKCAECGEIPILPHHMGCVHVFCYICLKGNQTADVQYECPTCGHINANIVVCDRINI